MATACNSAHLTAGRTRAGDKAVCVHPADPGAVVPHGLTALKEDSLGGALLTGSAPLPAVRAGPTYVSEGDGTFMKREPTPPAPLLCAAPDAPRVTARGTAGGRVHEDRTHPPRQPLRCRRTGGGRGPSSASRGQPLSEAASSLMFEYERGLPPHLVS